MAQLTKRTAAVIVAFVLLAAVALQSCSAPEEIVPDPSVTTTSLSATSAQTLPEETEPDPIDHSEESAQQDESQPENGLIKDREDADQLDETTTQEDSSNHDGDDDPVPPIDMVRVICIAVATVALLGLTIMLILYLRRKRQGKPVTKSAGLQVGNLHHIGQRGSQQDSFGMSNISDQARGVLAVVADGIGGLAGGAEISSIVTSHFLQNFTASSGGLDPAEQLLRMSMSANNLARRNAHDGINGSTVVAVILKNNQLWFVSVGDSRIYLLRDGALVQLNREHTMASQLDEDAARGRITVQEARSDKQRGALTSFIGIDNLRLIDRNLQPIQVKSGDKILLMTDGVFGTLNDEEMMAILTAAGPYEASVNLEQAVLAKAKPKQDNFTAIIMEV